MGEHQKISGEGWAAHLRLKRKPDKVTVKDLQELDKSPGAEGTPIDGDEITKQEARAKGKKPKRGVKVFGPRRGE